MTIIENTGTNEKPIEVQINDDPNDKKLLRKLDCHLIPAMTILYLLSYLDRVNIGQAKIDGLMESLKLTSAQYNACLSVFFATYVAFEIPSNLILKKLRPSRWIPSIMIAWGIVMTCMGFVNSYTSLLICRLFLGASESGLFPGVAFYLSSWYKRRELSWRLSFFFSAATLAGAFGGVLAFGIGRMNGLGGQEGWRWIFFIEGGVTVIVGGLSFFFINDFPSDRPKFLTEEECDRTIERLQKDAGPGASEHFSWPQVRAALLDCKVYIFCLCFIGIIVPFYSLSLFSPTIVQNLGYKSYRAQLMTAPPYAFAFVTTMSTAYLSDRFTQRAIFILIWLTFSIIGFIILICSQNSNVKYFGIFLTAGGISPCVSTCVTFISGNISPHTKRATALAMMLSFGNSGGAISGQIYRSQDAPRFIFGHAINLGFCVLSFIAAVALYIYFRYENRRRDHLMSGDIVYKTDESAIRTKSDQDIVDVFGVENEENRRKWGYENMTEQQLRDLGDKHVAWRYIL